MKKLKYVPIIALLFSTFFVSACSPSQTTEELDSSSVEQAQDDEFVLNVIYSPWPPDMMAFLAQEKGIFEKNGVNVNLVWGDGITEALELRASEEVNVWNFPIIDMVAEYTERKDEPGYNPQTFLVEDFSNGADALITRPEAEIETVADLRGKKVGVEVGTVGEFFLNIVLGREDLTLEDIEVVDMSFDEIPQALKDGDIQAGVTYEPDVSIAVDDGAVVLADTTTERGVIVDVYITQQENLENHPEAYEAFVKSFLEAAEYFESNPQESAEIMKDKLEMSAEEVIETFNTLTIPDLRANQAAFNRSSGFSSLYNLVTVANQYLLDQGSGDEDLDPEKLINPSIIEAVEF